LALEDHARAAAVGGLIDLAVFVGGVVADVVEVVGDGAGLGGPPGDGGRERAGEEAGEEGEDVDAHGWKVAIGGRAMRRSGHEAMWRVGGWPDGRIGGARIMTAKLDSSVVNTRPRHSPTHQEKTRGRSDRGHSPLS
jgi:hypothetical protein